MMKPVVQPIQVPPALEYSAEKPTWHKSRRARIAIAFLLAGALSVWMAKAVFERASCVYWLKNLNSDSPPAGMVVWSVRHVQMNGGSGTKYEIPVTPSNWNSAAGWFGLPRQRAIFFAGERRTTGGVGRVVIVAPANDFFVTTSDLGKSLLPGEEWLLFSARTVVPDSLGGQAAANPGVPARGFMVPMPQADIDICAGQPDPADRSKFSIDIRANGKSYPIVGQLLPDGTVSLTRADGRPVPPFHLPN